MKRMSIDFIKDKLFPQSSDPSQLVIQNGNRPNINRRIILFLTNQKCNIEKHVEQMSWTAKQQFRHLSLSVRFQS